MQARGGACYAPAAVRGLRAKACAGLVCRPGVPAWCAGLRCAPADRRSPVAGCRSPTAGGWWPIASGRSPVAGRRGRSPGVRCPAAPGAGSRRAVGRLARGATLAPRVVVPCDARHASPLCLCL